MPYVTLLLRKFHENTQRNHYVETQVGLNIMMSPLV